MIEQLDIHFDVLKYPVTFVFIPLRFEYIEARKSEFRKKLRTVTKAIDMIHKVHAFKTPVITLGNFFKTEP